MGGQPNTPPPSPPHGLMMSGEYKTANGLDMVFSTGGGVPIAGCGNLTTIGYGLAITPRGNGYVLELGKTTPKPVDMAFSPGNQITGPGAMTIDGEVITGSKTTVQSRRYSDGTIVPGSNFTTSTPIYGPATAMCSFGTFSAHPADLRPADPRTGPRVRHQRSSRETDSQRYDFFRHLRFSGRSEFFAPNVRGCHGARRVLERQ